MEQLDKSHWLLNQDDFSLTKMVWGLNKRMHKINKSIFDEYGGYGSTEVMRVMLEGKHRLRMYKPDEDYKKLL